MGTRPHHCLYDLPLSSIKEFRFQLSPYDWVEFEKTSHSNPAGRRT